MKILGIIPARYASSRFPGKALVDIQGKSMVHRTYLQATQCQSLDKVVVATDHNLIFDHCKENEIPVVMTSDKHQSGTDRCFEVVEKLDDNFDFVVNIQGDEPFINPLQIQELCDCLKEGTELATLVRPIKSEEILFDENKVKVVLNQRMQALYFSRQTIPYQRGHAKSEWLKYQTYYLHVGIYAYRTDILAKITALPLGSLEKLEALEQLRWLENGYAIQVNTTQFESHGVDTPADLNLLLEKFKP